MKTVRTLLILQSLSEIHDVPEQSDVIVTLARLPCAFVPLSFVLKSPFLSFLNLPKQPI